VFPYQLQAASSSELRQAIAMEDIEMGEDSDVNKIATLLEKIADNPYEYDSHVAYIALLRTLEDKEEVRSARAMFHSVFPFSEGKPLLAFPGSPLSQTCGFNGSTMKKARPQTTLRC
jgi:hypothetical protein